MNLNRFQVLDATVSLTLKRELGGCSRYPISICYVNHLNHYMSALLMVRDYMLVDIMLSENQ